MSHFLLEAAASPPSCHCCSVAAAATAGVAAVPACCCCAASTVALGAAVAVDALVIAGVDATFDVASAAAILAAMAGT